MKLAVGFITYNETSAKYLPDFLASLAAALAFLRPDDYQVLAFDNSGADFMVNRLAIESFNRVHPEKSPFIQYFSASGANLGFARAYNILISRAHSVPAEYFLVINPDTLLAPDAITELVKALDADPALASASPKIRRWDFAAQLKTNLIDSGGLLLRSGLRFQDLGQGQEDRGQFDTQTIIGPSGAAGLFRLSALEKIKLSPLGPDKPDQYFDEYFFMYKEDCDLAYRLQAAGLGSRLVPTALVYHDRTAVSAGQGLWRDLLSRRHKSRQIRAWSFRNQHFLFVKHWKKQNFVNKIIILFRFLSMFIFSLILEQFLLKEYVYIFHPSKVLTNVK